MLHLEHQIRNWDPHAAWRALFADLLLSRPYAVFLMSMVTSSAGFIIVRCIIGFSLVRRLSLKFDPSSLCIETSN